MKFEGFFKKKKEMSPAEVLPPAIFNLKDMDFYKTAAEHDGKLTELLMSRESILYFQEMHQGHPNDVYNRERLESAIAERYRQVVP